MTIKPTVSLGELDRAIAILRERQTAMTITREKFTEIEERFEALRKAETVALLIERMALGALNIRNGDDVVFRGTDHGPTAQKIKDQLSGLAGQRVDNIKGQLRNLGVEP